MLSFNLINILDKNLPNLGPKFHPSYLIPQIEGYFEAVQPRMKTAACLKKSVNEAIGSC